MKGMQSGTQVCDCVCQRACVYAFASVCTSAVVLVCPWHAMLLPSMWVGTTHFESPDQALEVVPRMQEKGLWLTQPLPHYRQCYVAGSQPG